MAKTTWYGKLEPRERLLVEHIAVKYDAAWRSGWTDEEGLWQNPYCEGMIESLAWLGEDLDDFTARRCVAEYCCKFGYMPMASQRPEWLEEHMSFIGDLWERESCEENANRFPLRESRIKLRDTLNGRGFEVHGGPRATKQWILREKTTGEVVYIEVFAHKDGSEADYVICNEAWNRVA